MHDQPSSRRQLLTVSAGAAAAVLLPPGAGGAQTSAPPTRPANAAFPALKRVRTGPLEVAYAELGPADGPPVLLLHGWPYDIHTYAEAAPILADAGYRVIVPFLRGYGATRFLSADTPRNAQQAALAVDALELLDTLGLKQAVIGGCDWGARTACILAALWPERCRALVSVSGYLIGSQALNAKPLPPEAERQWWYQYYFATERGRLGYAANTRSFARLIWETASPKWAFSDATFARSASALDNPDHVAITLHNYRWRLGLAEGEAKFDPFEQRLAALPAIGVPTITLEGDANGAPHPTPQSYAAKFQGPYQHRTVGGGVGHNLPQEAPVDFARAVMDADRLAPGRGRG